MGTNEAAERLREAIAKARREGDDHICVTMDFLEAALADERSAEVVPLDTVTTDAQNPPYIRWDLNQPEGSG